MRKFVLGCSAALAFITQGAFADHHVKSMEMFACNYADGKGRQDVLNVAAEWDKWADSNFSEPYRAYMMTPLFFTKSDFPMDWIWLGVSDSPSQMGTVNDEWLAKGDKLQAKFDKVSPCMSHNYMGSMELRPYPQLGEAGYVQVRSCTMKPGVSWGQVRRTNMEIAEWMEEKGVPGGNYLWWPGTGSAIKSDIDFYNVWITQSLAERGEGLQIFGANDWGDESYHIAGDDSIAECDGWRIWHAQPVGGKAAE
jgi:hypothetical protein